MKRVHTMLVCFLIFILTSGAILSQSSQSLDSTHYQNLEILSSVYRKVLTTYPGPIDPDKLMLAGINPMLKTIDPFTNFFTASEVLEFKSNLTGKFGGIGIGIALSNNEVIITDVFKGTPANLAGIQIADRILQIDGIDTKKLLLDDVLGLLRGTAGTDISISVKRPGESQQIIYNLKRDTINISPVPFYGMLNDKIAYIQLTRESENCSEEVRSALKELKDKYGFSSLVFDLRGNEGGYFKEAIKIANMFIEKGELLVSTRGKENDSSRYAVEEPLFPNTPLTLLIDNYTVSSGEILSGALQDNDRAVIIGQKSFGKGLVQEIFDMPHQTQLMLTTSHYFTPSGRCIQAFDYSNGETHILVDSMKNIFKTKNGRTVYSNGGIAPDIITDTQLNPSIVQSLLDDLLIFEYATQYKLKHLSIAPAETFYLTDEDYSDFIGFIKSNKFNYQTETENKLKIIKETAEKEGFWQTIEMSYKQLEKDITINKEKEIFSNKTKIKQELEKEILYRYYGNNGRYVASLRNDTDVKKAIEILLDTVTYNKILSRNN